MHASIEIIKVLYDAHPEAIEHDAIASFIHRCEIHTRRFLSTFFGRAMILDRESVEYSDSVFRRLKLKAHPETVMNVSTDVQPASEASSGQSGIGKKRKFRHE